MQLLLCIQDRQQKHGTISTCCSQSQYLWVVCLVSLGQYLYGYHQSVCIYRIVINVTKQAQRKSARFFSIVVWVCCSLSFIKYVISLALMVVYRQNMINTCIRSGIVGFGNSQIGLGPTTISTNSYYSPVKYPNTMNAHATSAEDCEHSIKMLIILWGVLIFIVQMVQVKTLL